MGSVSAFLICQKLKGAASAFEALRALKRQA